MIVALLALILRARLVGAGALTRYRNRELLYLAVVGVLTGSASRRSTSPARRLVSWGSLAYAVFFFALYLAAHLVARIAVPNADPTCCRWPGS